MECQDESKLVPVVRKPWYGRVEKISEALQTSRQWGVETKGTLQSIKTSLEKAVAEIPKNVALIVATETKLMQGRIKAIV